jgi:hypothetical protein
MAIPIINGNAYSWASIVTSIAGVPVTTTQGISYKSSYNKENIYGAGSQPIARGRGNVEYEGSIKLLLGEVMSLIKASPTNSLDGILPFDVLVKFIDDTGQNNTARLASCEFNTDGIDTSQGDTSIEVDLELVIGLIEIQ